MAGGGHGRGKRTRRVPYKSEKGVHHEPPAAEINVTPLVDVCLVLLIIFMVVTPMLGRGKAVRRCVYSNYCEGLDQMHKQVTCQLWDRESLDEPEILKSKDGRRRLVAPEWRLPGELEEI